MNSVLKYLLAIGILYIAYIGNSQNFHEDVLVNLSGEALEEALIETYTPLTVIDYDFARDTLYLKIDAINRNLSCIYTGLTLPIPEGEDPTQAVYLNGDKNGINAEHVFPQAFFTDASPPISDMNNLYPSRAKTNNDRANHPFGESPDNLTDIWYINAEERNSIPPSNIADYSEIYLSNADNRFEPREKVKGDIARSMFYIYCIYSKTAYAEAGVESFFQSQKETLCNWHFQDPVDEVEWTRTQKISTYQGNKNPFVLDCSVAQRLYCESHTESCKPVSAKDLDASNEKLFAYDYLKNELILLTSIEGKLLITTILGQNVLAIEINKPNESKISLHHLTKGNYVATYFSEHSSFTKLIQVR